MRRWWWMWGWGRIGMRRTDATLRGITGAQTRSDMDMSDYHSQRSDLDAMLTTTDHRRDSAGLTYVYPVISRRSGGLSIGINLNPNNACNWRCVYCQVPELRRGSAPQTDLAVLRQELRGFLEDVLHGDFYQRFDVPPEQRVIRDIAISGNGEPTSAPAFDRVVDLVGEISAEFGMNGRVQLVLITNGSLVRRETVQRGLKRWSELGGEVWFKLDSATEEGMGRVNGVHLSAQTVLHNLEAAARLCAVWIQTCVFAVDGRPPSSEEQSAYLSFLREARRRQIPLCGVLLYGLARPSMQPGSERLGALPVEWMAAFAEQIRGLGLEVRLHP
jgi:wyosine [tRNA(Phe)-imidazoG37] synthetase (radical SAM superfamily)